MFWIISILLSAINIPYKHNKHLLKFKQLRFYNYTFFGDFFVDL